MQSVYSTIQLSVFVAILMVIIEGALYFFEKSVRHRNVLIFWLAYLFYFGVSAVTNNGGPGVVALSTFPWLLRTLALENIVSDAAGEKLAKSWYWKLHLIAYSLGIVIYFLGGDFVYYTFPPAISNCVIGLHLMYGAWKCFKKRNRVHITHYILLITIFFISIHLLNYPLIRFQHSLTTYGFGFVLVTTIVLAVIMPAVTIYELHREREKVLEDIIRDRGKQLTEQSKFASLGIMTAGIVHEILNPLSVMKHRSSLLRSLVLKDKADKETMIKNLDQIELTGERMSKIINSLRKFSKSARTDSVAIDSVATIIEDTLSYCTDRFYYSNVALQVEPYPPINIQVRAVEISQVLLNLLNNSFDAVNGTPNPWVKIDFQILDDYLKILVIDSGNGIPVSVRKKIMEPFFTTKEEGTGLGLPISRGIMINHNGKLYLDETAQNTTFVIEIPYRAATVEA